MRKYLMEISMACLLLLCFYFLSREAAMVSRDSGGMSGEKTIVVDAGHGGNDPGMVADGLEEKKINLSISMKLKEMLEEKGFKVVLTRETDEGLYDENANNKKAQDLQRRIALISEVNPLLTVSIHQNSYHDPSVSGPQVFYYADSAQGQRLAEALQDSLNEGLAVENSRKPKGNTSYYLLKRSPGVLNIVECGFMTNADDAALLQTEEYQSMIAKAIADGICSYLGES